MRRASGILVSSFDFSPVAEDEFHDWYDTEHIPERERVPGFLACRRWMSVADPKVSMATYELSSVAVLRSPEYLAIGYENNSPWTRRVGWRCIKRLRFEGEQLPPHAGLPPGDAGGLVVEAVNVELELENEFDRWSDEERMPSMSRVPGVLCARRFRATASTHRHLTVYHLESPAVVETLPWKTASSTPWSRRVAPHLRDVVLTVCRRYVRAATA